MSFQLVPKSVILNDLERRNGRYFTEFVYDVVVKSSRSPSHLLMNFLFYLGKFSTIFVFFVTVY